MNPPGCHPHADRRSAATEQDRSVAPRRDGDGTMPCQARGATGFSAQIRHQQRPAAAHATRSHAGRPPAVAFLHVVPCREPKPTGARITGGHPDNHQHHHPEDQAVGQDLSTRWFPAPSRDVVHHGVSHREARGWDRAALRIEALLCPARALPTPAAAGPRSRRDGGGSCRCVRPAGRRQTGAGPPRNTHPYQPLQRPVAGPRGFSPGSTRTQIVPEFK
jgi:hypothetical protein